MVFVLHEEVSPGEMLFVSLKGVNLLIEKLDITYGVQERIPIFCFPIHSFLKKELFFRPRRNILIFGLFYFFCRRIKAENILALVLEKKAFIRILFVPV